MIESMKIRVLQRVVFPYEPDQDILPLYVESGVSMMASGLSEARRGDKSLERDQHIQESVLVSDRRAIDIPPNKRFSFGTYFNAFPASYWRRWTVVREVVLQAVLTGSGSLAIYRSNARGNIYRIESIRFVEAHKEKRQISLPLDSFADGGWYWFDIVASDSGARLEEAHWEAATDRHQGSLTIGVTTLNRPDDVVALLKQIGSDDALMKVTDAVVVVDQGVQHPEDADGFGNAVDSLQGKLRMIRQANLGGSGGFSRGMSETLDAGVSTYHLISDDDVRTEPEGILRAVAFADLARSEIIVGGQMFSMFDRAFLHSMGEKIQPWRFWWGPVINDAEGHHLDRHTLRTSPELHKRIDVDYNGWWMTLIPVSVLKKVGLSLPFFIKWDDAEYGIRSREVGVSTVTLPGAAVWHVPWTDKDDSIDWQAYYHQRNRFVSALIHSQFPRGGRLVRESMYHQIKHLLASQYSVAELRNQALRDLLSGPDHMHDQIKTKLTEIRQTRAEYDDSRLEKEPGSFPLVKRKKISRKGEIVRLPDGRIGTYAMAVFGVVKALRPIKHLSRQYPEAEVSAMDARWWLLAQFDSAVVSSADGSGAAWYKRQPQEFRRLFKESVLLHQQVLQEWPKISQEYRDALPYLVSQDSWKNTFKQVDS